MLGTFMSVMDVTVVNVAMPHMMGSFGEDLLTNLAGPFISASPENIE
jgi:hypothetical protein